MESESPQERKPTDAEKLPTDAERLAEWLGFKEDEGLKKIREALLSALASERKEEVSELLLGYQLQGESLLDGLRGGEYTDGQIGLIVARAMLSRDMGKLESFLYHIAAAKEYALQLHGDKGAILLEKLPSIEIARILSVFGEGYGFDEETVAEISDLPYDQAFEVAYGYLLQAGLDPDDILAVFIEHNLEAGVGAE